MARSDSPDTNDLIREALRRSSVDSEFRELLLRDSKAALKEVAESPLPAGLTLTFVDNSGPSKTIPLPDPVPGLRELSGEDLAAAAGAGGTLEVGWKLESGSGSPGS